MHQYRAILCTLLLLGSCQGDRRKVTNKRSIASLARALKGILKDSKLMATKSSTVSFMEAGGFKQAVQDFEALKTKQIDELTDDNFVVVNGIYENKGVKLVNYKNEYRTTLTVFKLDSPDSKITIVYPDDL